MCVCVCCVDHGWTELFIIDEDKERVGQELNGEPYVMVDPEVETDRTIGLWVRQRELKDKKDIFKPNHVWWPRKTRMPVEDVYKLLDPESRARRTDLFMAYMYEKIRKRAGELHAPRMTL